MLCVMITIRLVKSIGIILKVPLPMLVVLPSHTVGLILSPKHTCGVSTLILPICVCTCSEMDWHPIRVYSHIMPNDLGLDSDSTRTRPE